MGRKKQNIIPAAHILSDKRSNFFLVFILASGQITLPPYLKVTWSLLLLFEIEIVKTRTKSVRE